MVQKMVAIQTEENPRALNVSFARQMHAPMNVFVRSVICGACDYRANAKAKLPEQNGRGNKRHLTSRDQNRAVPPSHRNGVLVFLIVKVIGVIRFKNLVMHDGVRLKRVAKIEQGPVHNVPVECPFEKGGENDRDRGANSHPKYKINHGVNANKPIQLQRASRKPLSLSSSTPDLYGVF